MPRRNPFVWLRQPSQHKYIPIQARVEVGIDGQGNFQLCSSQQPHKTCWNSSFLVAVLVGFILCEHIFFFYNSFIPSLNRAVPRFHLEDVIIVKNTTWELGASKDTNALWETGVPGTRGWVQIAFPRSLGLPEGFPASDPQRPGDEVYMVTWGHQHHCLKLLRLAFWELIYGTSPFVGADMYGKTPNGSSTAQLTHLIHCWDYLRQTMACQGDLTLEGINHKDYSPSHPEIDGYNVMHKCKSRPAIARWLEDHSPTSTWAFRKNGSR